MRDSPLDHITDEELITRTIEIRIASNLATEEERAVGSFLIHHFLNAMTHLLFNDAEVSKYSDDQGKVTLLIPSPAVKSYILPEPNLFAPNRVVQDSTAQKGVTTIPCFVRDYSISIIIPDNFPEEIHEKAGSMTTWSCNETDIAAIGRCFKEMETNCESYFFDYEWAESISLYLKEVDEDGTLTYVVRSPFRRSTPLLNPSGRIQIVILTLILTIVTFLFLQWLLNN